jgi:hypothetical protein
MAENYPPDNDFIDQEQARIGVRESASAPATGRDET